MINSPLQDWMVIRQLPPETIYGLVTRQYKEYGGVIRDRNGRIVRHLIFPKNMPSSLIQSPLPNLLSPMQPTNAYQLARQSADLTSATNHLLQVSTNTMILSGLNLTVSAMGFTFLHQKFDSLETYLSQIQADVQEIRALLERHERAKLLRALNDLITIPSLTDPDTKRNILIDTRKDLGELHYQYREHLSTAETIETAMSYEEYFSLTALAYARATAELGVFDGGMFGLAKQSLEEAYSLWQVAARRIGGEMLIGENPERYLYKDFAEDLSVVTVVEWLDFLLDDERGFEWIDACRHQMVPWYANRNMAFKRWFSKAHDREREWILPSMNKLTARNKVFDGHLAQYELMEAQQLPPSSFEAALMGMQAEAFTDGYLILESA